MVVSLTEAFKFKEHSETDQARAQVSKHCVPTGIQYAESQAALQSQIQDFQAELQAMHKRVQVAERQGKRSFAGLKTKQECMTGHTSGLCHLHLSE